LLDIWVCRIGPFILRPRGFRTNNRGSSEVKSFGIHITNVAPGDFATNIASGRYHAPVIRAAYEVSYGESRTMDEHVDGGSNPNEMAEAVYKIIQTKEPSTL
jgi:short-subunit dehydrogenase